jgi:pre-rRNA-processing protein TSR3
VGSERHEEKVENSLEYIIIRHRKENLKKCSLRGFESNPRFRFYTYPQENGLLTEELLQGAFLLDMEGEELSPDLIRRSNPGMPFVLIDATWRYAQVMISNVPALKSAVRCTLPREWITAYPRKQTECPDPQRGLASIEALYVAAFLSGRSTDGLLDDYFWKDSFLEKNSELIKKS